MTRADKKLLNSERAEDRRRRHRERQEERRTIEEAFQEHLEDLIDGTGAAITNPIISRTLLV